jgi:aminoglycoside phosphotransferase (APT) family kinase protein
VRLADLDKQPLVLGEWVATVWKRVPTAARGEPIDLAAPLFAIHGLEQTPTDLPAWSTLQTCRRRVTEARQLPEPEATHLLAWSHDELGMNTDQLVDILFKRCDQLEAELSSVRWSLPPGVIHGDAHSGNLLLPVIPVRPAPARGVVLCDLDSVCVGPREWDLVPTAHGVVRFGRSKSIQQTFATAYGFDIMDWSGWPTLSAVRDLQLLTSVINNLAGRPEVARQLGVRLRSFLTGAVATWTPYY